MTKQLSDLGRFSDPSLVILTCLADGPKHGYAMITEGERLGVNLGLGTLYGALNRLERMGLIEALPPQNRRRPYRITPTGVDFLKHHLECLSRIIEVSTEKLGVTA
ncbi:MAG: PadR family transcriptional regulator [Dehalococcoidia bacterium]|nr:MAG: PadR family transcriptional regulator [Chloroflexota bacterium]